MDILKISPMEKLENPCTIKDLNNSFNKISIVLDRFKL